MIMPPLTVVGFSKAVCIIEEVIESMLDAGEKLLNGFHGNAKPSYELLQLPTILNLLVQHIHRQLEAIA